MSHTPMPAPAGRDGKEWRRTRNGQKRPRYSWTLRFVAPFLVIGWLVATGAAIKFIPPLQPTGSRTVLGAAIGPNAPAVQAAIIDAKRFDFPLASQVIVVQYRKQGLSIPAQINTLRRASQIDQRALAGFGAIKGAIPIANDKQLTGGVKGHATTALTFLLMSPSLTFQQCTLIAERYAHRYLDAKQDGFVGVTGAYPAEYQQGNAINSSLSLVQWLAIGVLILVVGLTFRSVTAPLLTLLSAGIAYVISRRLLSFATIHLGITVPVELDPIIVVLLLGLMTDYCVFYLTAFRRRLTEGKARKVAAPLAFTEVTPIVFVAGFTVASGVALIEIARLNLFSQLGPGLAITVAVTVLVAVSFVPAMLALVGKYALWPHMEGMPVGEGRRRFQKVVANPAIGSAVAFVAVGVLVWLSLPVGGLSIGINLIGDLPASSQPVQGATAAAHGFPAGVVAPTEVLVSGPAVRDTSKLDQLQGLITRQRGVATALGPADTFSRVPRGVWLSKVGPSALYLVILRHEPFGSAAIASFDNLRHDMPGMLKASGLSGVSVRYAGDTALSSSVTKPALSDLILVALAVVAVDFILLAIFLRALIAPLVLVAASSLVVAASLGITMRIFPSTAASSGYTFYVPFAAEVLLLSFGTDYNLFLTGEIWRAARLHRFREAVARGGAIASTGINVAGATLGLSFACLLAVPLRSFAELGAAIFAGLVIDTFIVRFFVVPGVLSLLGRFASWPGQRVGQPAPAVSVPLEEEVPHVDEGEPGASRSA